MLVEFLNIKHSHSHCEWYTLIKRQFCDQLLSVAYWTFALISYETVTDRDHEQLRPGHQPAGGRARPRHYAAQHQGGGAGGEVVRWAASGGADTQLEWILGLWSNCPNVGSPVSLGLFECENKSKYFQKSLPQLRMWMEMLRKPLEV